MQGPWIYLSTASAVICSGIVSRRHKRSSSLDFASGIENANKDQSLAAGASCSIVELSTKSA